MRVIVPLLSSLLLLSAAPALAQLDQILKEVETYSKPGLGVSGDAKIGAALKQALQVGTENAVKLTGKTDGYFANKAIKILMPDKMRSLEKGLRTIGNGGDVDQDIETHERHHPFDRQRHGHGRPPGIEVERVAAPRRRRHRRGQL